MLFEEGKKDALDVGIEVNGFGHGAGASVGVEASVANRERESASGEAGFAKALASFLRKMAEQRVKCGEIVGVFTERVIVGDGFGFGVENEFVGVTATRFAIESGAPLAEDSFEFYGRQLSELSDGLNAKSAKSAFR